MKSSMQVVHLSESQNASFDQEYHQPDELAGKIAFMRTGWPNELEILDLGGGNGVFMDAILSAIPYANGTVFDISEALLAKNTPNSRKSVMLGAIEDCPIIFGQKKFDVISFNWVLHHLVGDSYAQSGENCINALRSAASLLKPGGMIAVAETRFQGWLWSPGRLVFGITRIRNPAFVSLARRFFNTAGVGVCFRSEAEWNLIFKTAGLVESGSVFGDAWRWRLMYIALGLTQQQHKHSFLSPA